MHTGKQNTSTRALGLAVAVAAILAATPRETAPGRHAEPPPQPPLQADIALFEEIQAWFELTPEGARSPGEEPLHLRVSRCRESFELFTGAADADAVNRLLQQIPYGGLILDAARAHDIDPLLVAAIVQTESSFNKEAVSPKGALGLMQMMPTTAADMGLANAHDPGENVNAGVTYLGWLLRRFDNDLVLALAAWNAGPGAVDRFGGMPTFRETRGFTNSVLRTYIQHHRTAWAAVNPNGLDFAVLAGG